VNRSCRMIIDVDTGIDDAMAIFYAVRRPGIKLEALTTTFGNTDTALATTNTLRMLELLGRPEIPVAKGVARSLVDPYVRRADHVHGSNAIGDVELPEPKIRATDEHASDLIIRMAKENPGEITLCPVGPVTNVALALAKAPEIARLVRKVVIMGSTIFHPGIHGPTGHSVISPGFSFAIRAFMARRLRWSMRISPMIPKRPISCFGLAPRLPWSAWTSR
jgi:purine nucleosidase